MVTSLFANRQAATPPDLQSRLMGRLFGGAQPGVPNTASQQVGGLLNPAQSPTGLPISRPPTIASNSAGAAPTAAPAAAPAAPAAAPTGFHFGNTGGAPRLPGYEQGLSEADRKAIEDMRNSWYAGPDFKGRNEAGNFLSGYLGNLYRQWANEPGIDYSGESQIGSYYDAARSRQAAIDAAMGRSGGGVASAGQAALYGREGGDIGNYIRALVQQRNAEHQQQLNQFNQLYANTGMMGLQQNIQKQMSPSFLQSLLGTVGSVGGSLLGSVNPLSFLSHNSSAVGYDPSTYNASLPFDPNNPSTY